jgi:hypothetical protein
MNMRILIVRCVGHATRIITPFFLFLTACASTAAPDTIEIKPALPPARTATIPEPTTIPKPTTSRTPAPSPTSSCPLQGTLALLKREIAYDSFALHYNVVGDFDSFVVWFVDPDLDPFASGDALQANLETAIRHAAQVSVQLAQASPCVVQLANLINPIVVDHNYNGWYSGGIDPDEIPLENKLNDESISMVVSRFQTGYRRS